MRIIAESGRSGIRRFVIDDMPEPTVSLEETYSSHFANCPQAAEHRRGHGS